MENATQEEKEKKLKDTMHVFIHDQGQFAFYKCDLLP